MAGGRGVAPVTRQQSGAWGRAGAWRGWSRMWPQGQMTPKGHPHGVCWDHAALGGVWALHLDLGGGGGDRAEGRGRDARAPICCTTLSDGRLSAHCVPRPARPGTRTGAPALGALLEGYSPWFRMGPSSVVPEPCLGSAPRVPEGRDLAVCGPGRTEGWLREGGEEPEAEGRDACGDRPAQTYAQTAGLQT